MARSRYPPVRIAPSSYSSPRNNWAGAIPKSRWPDCPSAAVPALCLRHPISARWRRRSAALASAVETQFASHLRLPMVRCWFSSRLRFASRFQPLDDAAKNALGQEDDEDHQQRAVDEIVPADGLGAEADPQHFRQQDGDDSADRRSERDIEAADDDGKSHLQGH